MYRPPGLYDLHDLGATAANCRAAAQFSDSKFPHSSELPRPPLGSPTTQTGYWVSVAT